VQSSHDEHVLKAKEGIVEQMAGGTTSGQPLVNATHDAAHDQPVAQQRAPGSRQCSPFYCVGAPEPRPPGPSVCFVHEILHFAEDGGIRCPAVETPEETVLLRTNLLSTLESYQASLWRSAAGRSEMPLKTVLAGKDPANVLYTSDVALFRGRADQGYPFWPSPLSASCIVTAGTLAPLTQFQGKQVYDNVKVSSKLEAYSDEMDTLSLESRFELLLTVAYERGVKTLVLPLPGTHSGGKHPVEGVAFVLRTLVWKYASLFDEIIFVVPHNTAEIVTEIMFPSASASVGDSGPGKAKKQKEEAEAEKFRNAEAKLHETFKTEAERQKADAEEAEKTRHGTTWVKAQNMLKLGTKLLLGLRNIQIEANAAPTVALAQEARAAMLQDGTDRCASRGRRTSITCSEAEGLALSKLVVTRALPPVGGPELLDVVLHEDWRDRDAFLRVLHSPSVQQVDKDPRLEAELLPQPAGIVSVHKRLRNEKCWAQAQVPPSPWAQKVSEPVLVGARKHRPWHRRPGTKKGGRLAELARSMHKASDQPWGLSTPAKGGALVFPEVPLQ